LSRGKARYQEIEYYLAASTTVTADTNFVSTTSTARTASVTGRTPS